MALHWFNEHLQCFKNCETDSKFAEHIYNNKHIFGPIEEITDVLHVINKGNHMNNVEKLYTYSK